jgi:hypothetical protein
MIITDFLQTALLLFIPLSFVMTYGVYKFCVSTEIFIPFNWMIIAGMGLSAITTMKILT